MFAIVRTSGKQYKIAHDEVIKVNRMDVKEGDKVDLGPVLMVGDDNKTVVGAPEVKGATVKAVVLENKRDKKIIVFKKKRRQNYRRKHGHRQDLTVLRITEIKADGFSAPAKAAAPKKEAAPKAEKKAEAPKKEAATKKPAAKKPAAKK